MDHGDDTMKKRDPQNQSRLFGLPLELREIIWRCTVPCREYYQPVNVERIVIRRAHPAPHLGLLLACRQTFHEASCLKIKKTLTTRSYFCRDLSKAQTWVDFKGVDEVIYDVLLCRLEHDDADFRIGLLQNALVCASIRLQQHWSIVRFEHVSSIRISPGESPNERKASGMGLFKVEGVREIELRKVVLEDRRQIPNAYAEIESRFGQQEFQRLLDVAYEEYTRSQAEAEEEVDHT